MPRKSPFKHLRFPRDIIRRAVRWYLCCPLSFQDVVDLASELDVAVDRSTVFRWYRSSAPKQPSVKRSTYVGQVSIGTSPLGRFALQIACRAVDETYIRVGCKWRYLWRAIEAQGQMVELRLTARRDAKASKAFLTKAIERLRLHRPVTTCTDKAHAYRRVICEINHPV